MKTTLHFAALLATMICAPAAIGQDHLKLENGTRLVGQAAAYDEETHMVTFVTEDGRMLKIAADDLDAVSAYKLAKTKMTKGDAGDELKMGSFARDVGLYAHANRHYGNAEKLDPSLADAVEEQRVVLRREAAGYCMSQAKAALDEKDTKEAEKWLTTLLQKLPGEPEAAEAETMLAELYPQNHEPLDVEQGLEDVIAKELKTGKKHYDAMLSGIQKGLTNARSERSAKTALEGAWRDGERALKELDKVQRSLAKDGQDVSELFDGYRDLVHEHMVDAQLHIASMYTVQTDYKSALKAVNLALTVDPSSKEALAARARIENASSRGWGWR